MGDYNKNTAPVRRLLYIHTAARKSDAFFQPVLHTIELLPVQNHVELCPGYHLFAFTCMAACLDNTKLQVSSTLRQVCCIMCLSLAP